jgi:hypothetical protein
MHIPRSGLALVVFVFSVSFGNASEPAAERADWKKHFDDASATGTIVVIDERPSSRGAFVYNAAGRRCGTRRRQPSKSHTPFLHCTGAVRNEFQVFQWDGVRRTFS